jgi:hypothetical protein
VGGANTAPPEINLSLQRIVSPNRLPPLPASLGAEPGVDDVHGLNRVIPPVRQRQFAALKAQESLGLPAVAYSTAEFLHGPMDSKQAVVNTLLSRGVPFITMGTDTTREARLAALTAGRAQGPNPGAGPTGPTGRTHATRRRRPG